jgi:uncharacterized protein YutE (UPF0331/DUF86 family)
VTGRLVYEADADRRIDFESTTCVRAFDFLPTHELSVRGQREGLLRRMNREANRMTTEELLARAHLVRANLKQLDSIPQESLDEFESDPRNLQATLHLLQTSNPGADRHGELPLCATGAPSPRSSRDIFAALEADGRLPKGTTDEITPLIGFRNRVVHLYDRVDTGRVFDVLRDHRGDIERLLRLVLEIDVDLD